MNARDELNAKLAEVKQSNTVERIWGQNFVVSVSLWTLVVAFLFFLWGDGWITNSDVILGVAVSIYAAGIAGLVVLTWRHAVRKAGSKD